MVAAIKYICICICIFNCRASAENNKSTVSSAGIDLSVFPVHKASLLGLTATENPTFGVGFWYNKSKWLMSFNVYHEEIKNIVFLSQFETQLTCNIIDNERFGVLIQNISVSMAKGNTIFMIPSVILGVGRDKALKLNATPYTWGFNSGIHGYNYGVQYDKTFAGKKTQINFGFNNKLVYANLTSYKGFIGEISPFLNWKYLSLQTRCIYQFSLQKLIVDINLRSRILLK